MTEFIVTHDCAIYLSHHYTYTFIGDYKKNTNISLHFFIYMHFTYQTHIAYRRMSVYATVNTLHRLTAFSCLESHQSVVQLLSSHTP